MFYYLWNCWIFVTDGRVETELVCFHFVSYFSFSQFCFSQPSNLTTKRRVWPYVKRFYDSKRWTSWFELRMMKRVSAKERERAKRPIFKNKVKIPLGLSVRISVGCFSKEYFNESFFLWIWNHLFECFVQFSMPSAFQFIAVSFSKHFSFRLRNEHFGLERMRLGFAYG